MLLSYLYVFFKNSIGLKGKNDLELEAILTSFIKIFAYLSFKDLFFKFYGKQLAKRLINNNSLSIDFERDIIKRLSVIIIIFIV